jgi:acetyl-CoA C-acetyltransferase
MLQEAANALSKDIPGLKPKDVDGLIFASTTAGRNSNSLNTAPIVAHRLGIKPSSICVRVDTLCSGSNTAIILATGLIQSGIADVIMVCGTEKLNMPQRWDSVYMNLLTNDHDWDAAMGLAVPPPFFAMIAQAHMKKYGTTKEQMGAVAMANYAYAFNNPNAQFGGKIQGRSYSV